MTGSRSRRTRISRSADFDRVYRSGKSHANRLLVVHTFPRGDGEPSRLGLSVSRKVGGSVERNRVKRLIREAFDEHAATIEPGFDVVVVARGNQSEGLWDQGLPAVSSHLRDLLAEAGVISGDEVGDEGE